MRYWKLNNSQAVESCSNNQNTVKNATEITESEFNAFIAALPPPPEPEPEQTAILHWARVSTINLTAVKPLQVTRTLDGRDYTFNCYVSESIISTYQAGKLAVGDFVVVAFVDGDLDKPLAMEKVRKTW